jgi:hypothetical protein
MIIQVFPLNYINNCDAGEVSHKSKCEYSRTISFITISFISMWWIMDIQLQYDNLFWGSKRQLIKTNLDLLATITLVVAPFHAFAPFPALLPFFKCILEVVFCKGVQYRLWFCLDLFNCVKMMAFLFYLQSGGLQSNSFLVKNSLVRWCAFVIHQPVLLSPQFRVKF